MYLQKMLHRLQVIWKKFINYQAMMQLLKHLILLKNLEGKNIHILSNHRKNNFDELITFFDYPTEIRKMIYTTNTIENLNRNIRKITKTKGAFTNTQLLSKIIYICLINIQEDYDSRAVHNWPQILNQLTILFWIDYVV